MLVFTNVGVLSEGNNGVYIGFPNFKINCIQFTDSESDAHSKTTVLKWSLVS
jgi:hypothetical protein